MLKLAKRHGSPYFYLRGTIRGISIDESTRVDFRNRKAAEEIKAKRQAELHEESIHGKRAVATFSQTALSYIEAGGETKSLAPIVEHFGPSKLAAIGQDEIDKAARKLFPKQSSSTQKRHVYTPISAVLNHAAKRGWCIAFKIERPKDPPPRVRWITHEEADTL